MLIYAFFILPIAHIVVNPIFPKKTKKFKQAPSSGLYARIFSSTGILPDIRRIFPSHYFVRKYSSILKIRSFAPAYQVFAMRVTKVMKDALCSAARVMTDPEKMPFSVLHP
jgi:hypothetical protein